MEIIVLFQQKEEDVVEVEKIEQESIKEVINPEQEDTINFFYITLPTIDLLFSYFGHFWKKN